MKVGHLVACLGVASVVLMGAAGSATAADEWYVLGEKTIKSGDPSTELKSKGDRWENDIKRIKISVQGADVEITKIVFRWDGRPDDDHEQCRSPEVGRRNGSEGRSGTQGPPRFGGSPVQDPWWCNEGHSQALGIRLSERRPTGYVVVL